MSIDSLLTSMSAESIQEWAETQGAHDVWEAWRDGMILQKRDVADNRLNWDTLPEQDQRLDVYIATRILARFILHLTELQLTQAANGIRETQAIYDSASWKLEDSD